MDKWFKDILPDKDPYHNRGRDQMRKRGVRNSSACGVTPGCNSISAKTVSIFKIFDVRHGSLIKYFSQNVYINILSQSRLKIL
jgi:hypothetical protein